MLLSPRRDHTATRASWGGSRNVPHATYPSTSSRWSHARHAVGGAEDFDWGDDTNADEDAARLADALLAQSGAEDKMRIVDATIVALRTETRPDVLKDKMEDISDKLFPGSSPQVVLAAAKKRRRSLRDKVFKVRQGMTAGVDLCFVIDATGSMTAYVKKLAVAVNDVLLVLSTEQKNTRVAVVVYTDIGDESAIASHFSGRQISKHVAYLDFTDDVAKISEFLTSVLAYLGSSETVVMTDSRTKMRGGSSYFGNSDLAEDMIYGLHIATKLKWESCNKLLIVLGDEPCHGKEFQPPGYESDRWPNDNGMTSMRDCGYTSVHQVLTKLTDVGRKTESKVTFPAVNLIYIPVTSSIEATFAQFKKMGFPFDKVNVTSSGDFKNGLLQTVTESVTSTSSGFTLPTPPGMRSSDADLSRLEMIVEETQ